MTYGAYMALSSNLRYQMVAGLIEQRCLEPLLTERYPAALGPTCLVIRLANTFIGSLLWVDFARFTGLQPH